MSDYGADFEGGRFVFEDEQAHPHSSNKKSESASALTFVEPRVGRLSLFSSGSENVHRVEKVTRGIRYALTIAFTCDKSKQISDFLHKFKDFAVDG